MPDSPSSRRTMFAVLARALARTVIRVCAPIVPADRRDDWRAEWEAEVWHRAEARQSGGIARDIELARMACGALPHAIWLLWTEWKLHMILQDLSYALRTSRKRPAFTAFIVAMLAVGIGATTTMFTVVNSVLLRPLPYTDAGQLVALNGSFSKNDDASISPPDFLDYRASSKGVFAAMAAYQNGEAVVSGQGTPERVTAWRVTADYFKVLGVAPMRGRTFLEDEENESNPDVVILSFGFWQRHFGADAKVLGSTVRVDGAAMRVVGIMPPALDQTLDVDLWTAYSFRAPGRSIRRFHNLRGLARLAPGVTLEQARTAMDVVAKRLEATYPENATWRLRVRPYQEAIVGGVGPSLMILFGAVTLVLLIACGNVASLLLARATSRRGEIGIRAALGASRTRLVRQLLTESLLLSLSGGAAGLGLSLVLLKGIHSFGSALVPRLSEVAIDPMVLTFTAIVAVVTGLAFGLAPALQAVGRDLTSSFAALGRSSSAKHGVRLRDGLVVGQVALSLVLLVAAGLLMKSLWELQRVPPGFDADHVFTARVSLPPQQYADRDAQARFWNEMIDRVRATSGVTSASATTMLPMLGGGDTYFWRADQPPAKDSDRRSGMINLVGDDYFSTFRIPIISGRTFTPSDRDGPNAVVLNERFIKRVFPDGENPLGKQLIIDFGTPTAFTIVGVVGDVRAFGPASNAPGILYFSVRQPAAGFGASTFTLIARTSGDPTALTEPVRAILADMNRDIPLMRPRAMTTVVAAATADARLAAELLGGFAAVALILAVVGLYGVLSFAVAQRSRELAIRIAFGAQTGQVFSMVVGRGMAIVGIGAALGALGAFAANKLIARMLFQVHGNDPMVLAAVALSLLTTGIVACVAPARRATRVDPVVVLRGDI